MKNILVTGANGQLGRKLFDNSGILSGWNFLFTDLPETDITKKDDIDKLFADEQIDIIINCAAYTAVDKAEEDEANAHMVNAVGPHILAEKAKLSGAKLIHISTDYVFDGQANTPYVETNKVNPVSIYGKTKREGEEIVLNTSPESIIIRTSWLYSEYGHNFAKTILKYGTIKEKLNVVFDQVGTPTYAGSFASAILMIITDYENTGEWKSGIYHYSNQGVCSWYDFAVFLLSSKGINTPVIPVRSSEFKTVAKRPSYSVLDKTKITKTFGINIPHWTDSCLEMIQKL